VQINHVFTLFLTSPVLALARLFALDGSTELMERISAALDDAIAALANALRDGGAGGAGGASRTSSESAREDAGLIGAPEAWHDALADPIPARIILRFALYRGLMVHLKGGYRGNQLPRARPELPASLCPGSAVLGDSIAAVMRTVHWQR
jgi:hypothetical protein